MGVENPDKDICSLAHFNGAVQEKDGRRAEVWRNPPSVLGGLQEQNSDRACGGHCLRHLQGSFCLPRGKKNAAHPFQWLLYRALPLANGGRLEARRALWITTLYKHSNLNRRAMSSGKTNGILLKATTECNGHGQIRSPVTHAYGLFGPDMRKVHIADTPTSCVGARSGNRWKNRYNISHSDFSPQHHRGHLTNWFLTWIWSVEAKWSRLLWPS